MEDIDLSSITKSKITLAEALKQIETVNFAFSKAERIEKKLAYQESMLHDINKSLNTFASLTVVNTKLDEFMSKMEKMIKNKFEEFNSQYLYQLNEKSTMKDVEAMISQRVTWTAFNNYTQQLSSIKTRIEKHMISDFEGFKTKVKLELSRKADEKKTDEELSFEEITLLKNRVTALEQKYREMFMDEELGDSEDYDSQEAMDNFIEDVDKNNFNRNSDEALNENEMGEEEFQDIPKKQPSPIVPMGSFDTTKVQPLFNTTSIPPFSPEISSPRSENMETAKTEVSDESSKVPDKIEKGDIVERPHKPEIVRKSTFDDVTKNTEAAPVPIRKADTGEGINEAPKPKSRSSIEIENLEVSPRMPRGRGAPSSRADGQTLTRKNSMASSMGGGGGVGGANGGIRQLNKKVMGLQKDIETNKALIDELNNLIIEQKSEFGNVYDRIQQARERTEEIEKLRQAMEMSFIKALRRNGIDRKAEARKKVITQVVDSEEIIRLTKKVTKKSSKIKEMSTYIEKVAADITCIKEKQNAKINQIIQSLRQIDESRNQLSKDVESIAGAFTRIESNLVYNMKSVQNEVKAIQGPITDYISDQQRENEILTQDLRKHQKVLKDVIYEFTSHTAQSPKCGRSSCVMSPEVARASSTSIVSPNLTAKVQLAMKNTIRKNSITAHGNWLEDLPHGTQLQLPRIKAPISSISIKKSL
ncbi:hypothetical protein SteCoe_26148 [Stentor coeruleus]|uniref:Uncharacterized protein n=1 Tax=Stentor coeruleus TaxID=5963 RepID=A0A1R2BDL4_9CILI|nr:hypothetical protein SteCoe_26148 [Stentor coeruleus]